LNHPGKCANLHGHNAVVESESLNDNNMVIDFEIISSTLKNWINETFDHKVIVNIKDDLIPLFIDKRISHYATEGDPTSECLAKIIFDEAVRCNLPIKKVAVSETPTSQAVYHP
jgi:6-pyruvoyltetrahydropterin/6-carboxytetrahydropterin synthase